MKHRILFYSLIVLMVLCLANCAKRGMPTGGDKDDIPPKTIKSQPEPFSTNFDAKRIRIYFDEYIKLNNSSKQLIISPPLSELGYSVYPLGGASKYVDIKILDTLKPNTTYSFNFGQSIVDNNEGNPYEYFKYVFSTGSYLDSLTLNGEIKDALLKTPDEFVSVMLYAMDSTYTDSIVYKDKPTYITNTLDSVTSFQLTNLKAGKYKLIALKDESSNYIFDQASDKIGYVEEFVTVPTDSVYELKLFKEVLEFRATRPSQISNQRIAFGFEGIPEDMKIELLSNAPKDFKYRITRDLDKDSLYYWHTPITADSLLFKVSKDTFYAKEFTVKLKEKVDDSLVVRTNYKGNIPLNKNVEVILNTPLATVDDKQITILDQDSIAVAFKTALNIEENRFAIDFKKTQSNRYTVSILPDAIKDFYGNTNDTLSYSYSTKKNADYGTFRSTLNNINEYPIIIQLTNDKGEVKAEKYVEKPQPFYDFNYLNPSDYYIRVIFDTNKNGKWDTGNYLKNIQPERISYHPKLEELRANWDANINFTVK